MASDPASFGRYEVRGVLGRGGMGRVFLAYDPVIGREVAIKVLDAPRTDGTASSRELAPKLETEYRVAGSLSHPHVVTILDVGHDGDHPYIAMERVDGPSLGAVLARKVALSDRDCCRIVEHVASALDHAHSRGVVHRDVKPSNILLTSSGRAKVADFGIATLATGEATDGGGVVGTPWYMSPEQVRGDELSGASDQFALAVVALELLTGKRPFPGDDPAAVLAKIVHEPPRAPRQLRPSLPAAAEGVLLKALAKAPGDRHASCSEFARALRTTLVEARAEDESSDVDASALSFDDIDHGPTRPSDAPLRRHARLSGLIRRARRVDRWFWGVAACVVAAVAVTVAALWLGTAADPTSAATATPELVVVRVPAAPPRRLEHRLRVASEPAGAEIWVDGSPAGAVTPAEITLAGLAGEEMYLSLRRRGLLLAETSVVIGAGAPHGWSPRLSSVPTPRPPVRPTPAATTAPPPVDPPPAAPPTRTLVLDVVPEDVRVTVDGSEVTTTAPVQVTLHPGATVRLERSGFEPWQLVVPATLVTASAEPLELQVILLPTSPLGRVDEHLRTVRAGVEVEVPELEVGQEPVYPDTLPAGTAGIGVYEVTLDPHGRVAQVTTLRSVAPAVDEAATRAILVRRYRPSRFKGKPVNVVLTVTMPYPPRGE